VTIRAGWSATAASLRRRSARQASRQLAVSRAGRPESLHPLEPGAVASHSPSASTPRGHGHSPAGCRTLSRRPAARPATGSWPARRAGRLRRLGKCRSRNGCTSVTTVQLITSVTATACSRAKTRQGCMPSRSHQALLHGERRRPPWPPRHGAVPAGQTSASWPVRHAGRAVASAMAWQRCVRAARTPPPARRWHGRSLAAPPETLAVRPRSATGT
jgi:hypothetical protein